MNASANRIAKAFIKATAGRATPAIMKKNHAQAKTLLQAGYTEEEILRVLTYLVEEMKVEIYSMGYISACINDTLRILRKRDTQEAARKARQEHEATLPERNEVNFDDASARRNQDKSGRFGLQSRFGEESFSDLFEGS